MRELLLVGGGGFLGSISRFLLSAALTRFQTDGATGALPVGTLAVNVVGCLIIGLLAGAGGNGNVWSDATRRFLFTGVLGGFTTFSAFGHETFSLARDGRLSLAVANALLQVGCGLLAVWAGYRIAS
ncbi:MAG: fluoride efflux transporter CrcB [Gemmatimonas sp.]